MKFCTGCGTALELFEFLDGELCSSCQKNTCNKKPASGSSKTPGNTDRASLSQIIVAVQDSKLVMKSAEGWILWSGSLNDDHRLDTILSQAERILKIRTKRQKN